jgi:hypothetical protein
MTNILLEASTTGFGVFEQLANYGALGLVVLALGAVGWYMFKHNMAEKDAMQAKINELEKELRDKK